jgi:hypothetical protein
MAQVGDFLSSAASWAKDFWAGRPEDILLLGFIVGFFTVFASWQNKRLSDLGGFLLKLRNLSSAAIIFICFSAAAYIAVRISGQGCAYYLLALVAGMAACRIFLLFLSLLSLLGDVIGTLLNIASGPVGGLAAWLFYKNQLLPWAENLLGQIWETLGW